jgi:hypothetical protein
MEVATFFTRVIAGLDPAIPIIRARLCLDKRDGRVKPGHDHQNPFSPHSPMSNFTPWASGSVVPKLIVLVARRM